MSLQNLINIAETLEINRQKTVGQQITRSGVVKVGETPTRNPWRFNLTIPALKPYADARALMESIDYYDRTNYQDISFDSTKGAVNGLSYMFNYRGDLTLTQRNTLRVSSFSGDQLTLTGLPTGNAGQFIVRAGDVFQIDGYPYPFSSISDVIRGSGATVIVRTHRPNFITASVQNASLIFGNAVQFRMIATSMPTYSVIPGPYVQINGQLQLHEYTGLTA